MSESLFADVCECGHPLRDHHADGCFTCSGCFEWRTAKSAPQRLFPAREALHAFHTAAGYAESTVPGLREVLHEEEHRELMEALRAGDDLKAIARELADVVYVAFGSALSLGIDLDIALAEVHRANMQKAVSGVRREDGKILKPADFVPPDMTEAVA